MAALSFLPQISDYSPLIILIHPIYFKSFPGDFIFVPVMALLDLDKIIIKRTVIGIRCISCGGNLVTKKRSVICRIVNIVSFTLLKPQRYECENCKKKHILL